MCAVCKDVLPTCPKCGECTGSCGNKNEIKVDAATAVVNKSCCSSTKKRLLTDKLADCREGCCS